MPTLLSPDPEPLLVACFCAQWCGVCRDYAPLMARVMKGFDAREVRSAWIDIEDNDEVLGDLDVQSFPTLLIARGAESLFFGVITPHEHTLARLVQSALANELPGLPGNGAGLRALVAQAQAFARWVD